MRDGLLYRLMWCARLLDVCVDARHHVGGGVRVACVVTVSYFCTQRFRLSPWSLEPIDENAP